MKKVMKEQGAGEICKGFVWRQEAINRETDINRDLWKKLLYSMPASGQKI